MKRLFLGSVALVALGLGTPAASAADMRVAPAPVAPPAYTWSGCYIGGGGGYSSGRATQYTAPGAVVTPALGVAPGAVPGLLAYDGDAPPMDLLQVNIVKPTTWTDSKDFTISAVELNGSMRLGGALGFGSASAA